MINPIVNGQDIERLCKAAPVIAKIHSQYGPPPEIRRPEGFQTLVKIILEQQVSLASAKAHYQRLQAYLIDITPRSIIQASEAELKACHLSRQKTTYVKALANAVLSKSLQIDTLSKLSESEVRAQLTAIRGVGDWTADVYLMFSLQAKDIFPIGDITIINTMKEFNLATSKNEAFEYAQQWRPLRSLAAYYLWHFYLKKRKREWVSA